MRKETIRLAEAARSLRLARTDRAAPHCVRIGVPAGEFPTRLADLQAALEAFDASGAAAEEAAPEPVEVENMRSAIDGVFRWMKLQGIDTEEPLGILADGMTGKARKRQASFDMLPSYAPGKVNKKKDWKPKLSLGSELGKRDVTVLTMGGHSTLAMDMQQAALKLGAVEPRAARPRPTPMELLAMVDADLDEPEARPAMSA